MLIAHLNRKRLEREAAGLRRQRRIVDSPCTPHLRLAAPDGSAQPQLSLSFCSNDYLGLANHPQLAAALAEGARRWGVGSGASHLVSGHNRAHADLEARLAAHFSPYLPQARALLCCSGFTANLTLLTVLGSAGTDATLFADKLNHASLIDGGLLAAARMRRYPHGRFDLLDALLAECTTPLKFIVTDSVFSMDGDLADVPALLRLAERHDAWLVLDDAHGFGVLGEHGLGVLEHFDLHSERLIYMGTLGKAAGVAGAFVAAHADIIDALIQGGRSYIYTTAPPAALAHAVSASLDVLTGAEGRQRRAHLHTLIAHLRERLRQWLGHDAPAGWHLPESGTAIQPLLVGDNDTALALAAALEHDGLWVPAIRPPTVPAGTARLRITLSAAHTHADIDRLCDSLARAARAGLGGAAPLASTSPPATP